MLEVLDATTSARAAIGLPERGVVLKQRSRPRRLPIVTVIGLQFGLLLGGAIVCELIFAVAGDGPAHDFAIYNAISPRRSGRVRDGDGLFTYPRHTSSSTWDTAGSSPRQAPGMMRPSGCPSSCSRPARVVRRGDLRCVPTQLAPLRPDRGDLSRASAAARDGRGGQRAAAPARHRPVGARTS